jgi:5-methylcytosine-specific restriction endonuclease McrA
MAMGEDLMPFVPITDVGTTARHKLTPHRRLIIWEKAAGVCVLCNRPIDGVRERWVVEHIRALELGGADDRANMAPAHEACALAKTQEDHRRAGRAKRQKIRHIGANEPKRPLPFGRGSRWKRTLSGKIVPRE